MANLKIPYVTLRADGRPRFTPSKRERALGFAPRVLAHEDGRWFTLEEARAYSLRVIEEIKQARLSGRKRPKKTAPTRTKVADLIADWLAAVEARVGDAGDPISPETFRTYRTTAAAMLYKPETRAGAKARRAREAAAKLLGVAPPKGRELEPFGQANVATIGKVELLQFFNYLRKVRGHHLAHGAMTAFSAAYSWGGSDPRWRLGRNPRLEMRLKRPAGRIRVYCDDELRALDAAAAALGRWSVGDAIWLGVFTAQRQSDRLAMVDGGAVDGRRIIRQNKTGRVVAIRDNATLVERLEAARKRVNVIKLRMGTRPDTIVVDESTGEPYNSGTYRHVFAEVRALAIAGSATLGLKPCPTLAGSTDQDLRDTAVTWLARAGCELTEICAISGHSANSAQTIIRHYLGDRAALADAAVDKLTSWMERQGINLNGPAR